jgi:pyruvate, water dikinase
VIDAGRIRALDEVGAADVVLAGGKAANLGELIRAGFRVPGGFVVTAGAELTPELAEEIRAAYRALGSPPVAVRSSATAEDSAEASFAGQHDTLLSVRGEEAVVDAVAHCLRSIWTERAVRYRAERGFDDASVSIATVVQEMAPQQVSGVVFTVNPLSARRDEVLVNAAAGSGEAVVSGEVVPDQWVARRPDGAVVDFVPARRARGPFMAPARGALSSDQVRELVQLSLRVEQHFGGAPQDIEWSYGDGGFHLLQARPITTLP